LAILESQNWLVNLMPAFSVTSSKRSFAPAVILGVIDSAATGCRDTLPRGAERLTDLLKLIINARQPATPAAITTAILSKRLRAFLFSELCSPPAGGSIICGSDIEN
jgi:hypothetical protein